MKKLLLYLSRWQLSTPILYACVSLIPFGNLTTTILANLIGGLIFYRVDQWIFNRKKGDKTNSLDRMIKRKRKRRYKRIKKITRARDIASKYLSENIKVSNLDKYFGEDVHKYFDTVEIAKRIIDEYKVISYVNRSDKK